MIILKHSTDTVRDYLASIDFLRSAEDIVALAIPGDGNMNFTLRVTTSERSFIVKQSRDYVEKYPQVAAPADRAMQEAAFYQAIQADEGLAQRMPTILLADPANNILIMEDLGKSTDYASYYTSHNVIDTTVLDDLVDYLIALHSRHEPTAESKISNTAMRQLNHEHMYVYPLLDNNGLDLDQVCDGLQSVASDLRKNTTLKSKMAQLGRTYLEDGHTLLHGDYFLGSWLDVDGKTYVIDPEFGHHGRREFEIGVMKAHLMMAHQPNANINHSLARYTKAIDVDGAQVNAFAGGEIIRRLIGLAQLPLQASLEQRQKLLKQATDLVLAY
jgi:5-methylthioribose kinase